VRLLTFVLPSLFVSLAMVPAINLLLDFCEELKGWNVTKVMML
jgi:hypothetical protein